MIAAICFDPNSSRSALPMTAGRPLHAAQALENAAKVACRVQLSHISDEECFRRLAPERGIGG